MGSDFVLKLSGVKEVGYVEVLGDKRTMQIRVKL